MPSRCPNCKKSSPLRSSTLRAMRAVDLAWLTGIFEGEGYIALSNRHWQVGIGMSDRDVIERVAALTGIGSITIDERGLRRPGRKTMFTWRICGHAEIVDFLDHLLPLLGHRRSSRARDAIQAISERTCARHAAVVE